MGPPGLIGEDLDNQKGSDASIAPLTASTKESGDQTHVGGNTVFFLLTTTVLHTIRDWIVFLRIDSQFYKTARNLCAWLELVTPEVSQRAGFKYDLGWLAAISDDEITEGLSDGR